MKNLLFVAVVNLLLLPTGPFAQSNQAPVATPTDVKPGSITCEGVFHDMARNTRLILQSLKIDRVMVVGHSMGGMLAARFATQYPTWSSAWCFTTRSVLSIRDSIAPGTPPTRATSARSRQLIRRFAAR